MFEAIGATVLLIGIGLYTLMFPIEVKYKPRTVQLTKKQQMMLKICQRHQAANRKFKYPYSSCEIVHYTDGNAATSYKNAYPFTYWPFGKINEDAWLSIPAYRKALGSIYYLYDQPREIANGVIGYRTRKGPEFITTYKTIGRPSPVMVRITPSGKFYVGKKRCRDVIHPQAVISCEEAKKALPLKVLTRIRI